MAGVGGEGSESGKVQKKRKCENFVDENGRVGEITNSHARLPRRTTPLRRRPLVSGFLPRTEVSDMYIITCQLQFAPATCLPPVFRIEAGREDSL